LKGRAGVSFCFSLGPQDKNEVRMQVKRMCFILNEIV